MKSQTVDEVLTLSFDPVVLNVRERAAVEAFLAGRPVLGIEVTDPGLAALCSLGNLDPQHSSADDARAAIEAAVDLELPPRGSTLATIRPDLDSFGAMAILELRAAGKSLEPALARIGLIAAADCARRGPWPGPSLTSLPGASRAKGPLAGIGAIVGCHELDAAERTRRVVSWLVAGDCQGLAEAEAVAPLDGSAAAAWVRLGPARRSAVVRSAERGATELGYHCAPVVVAENPAYSPDGGPPYRKLTIAQWDSTWLDMRALLRVLSTLEPGWGGSATICGSPQGRSSRLALRKVVDLVETAVQKGCE